MIGERLVEGAVAPYRGALRIGLIVLAAVAVGFVVWWVFVRPAQSHKAAEQAKVSAKASESQAQTAKDAVATGEAIRVEHERIERVTRENTTRIIQAPGAADRVPDGVFDAFAASVCVYHAYDNDPSCPAVPRPASGVGEERHTGGAAAK